MISFASNIDAFARALTDTAQNQVPFAAALALNDTAADVRDAREIAMRRQLDRPRPFTVKGQFIKRASKRALVATVGPRDLQAKYLRLTVTGGVRTPTRKALAVPSNVRLNAYGNMARGLLGRLQKQRGVFVGTIGGTRGVWQRQKQDRSTAKPKLLVSLAPRATYKKTLNLDDPSRKRAQARFPHHFGLRFAMAIRTQR